MEARIEQVNCEEAYRIYIAESLRLSPQGMYLASSYKELILNEKEKLAPTGDEIVSSVMKKAGLKFTENNK